MFEKGTQELRLQLHASVAQSAAMKFWLRLLFLINGCLALATFSAQVRAQQESAVERPPVEFERQAVESELGEEVAVRIIGELQALGFEVVLHSDLPAASNDTVPSAAGEHGGAPSSDHARLVLNERDGLVVVETWCPTCDTPLVQTWHANQPRSAETIAVRSVEALRASLLVYSKRQERSQTRAVRPRSDKEQRSIPKPPASTPTYRVSLGPTLSLQVDRSTLSPGLFASMSFGFDSGLSTWSAGVRLGGSPSVEHFIAAEGQAWINRWFVDGFVEFAPRVAERVELIAQVGAGFVAYKTRSQAAQGFAAVQQSHQTLLASARGGVRLEIVSDWSLAVLVGAETTLNAPVIRFAGRPLATLDNPAGFAGLALSLVL